MKSLHIGISKRNRTVVVQAVETVDQLSNEIYLYYGERLTTKKNLKENKQTLLNEFVKMKQFENCTRIVVE